MRNRACALLSLFFRNFSYLYFARQLAKKFYLCATLSKVFMFQNDRSPLLRLSSARGRATTASPSCQAEDRGNVRQEAPHCCHHSRSQRHAHRPSFRLFCCIFRRSASLLQPRLSDRTKDHVAVLERHLQHCVQHHETAAETHEGYYAYVFFSFFL